MRTGMRASKKRAKRVAFRNSLFAKGHGAIDSHYRCSGSKVGQLVTCAWLPCSCWILGVKRKVEKSWGLFPKREEQNLPQRHGDTERGDAENLERERGRISTDDTDRTGRQRWESGRETLVYDAAPRLGRWGGGGARPLRPRLKARRRYRASGSSCQWAVAGCG
jgi:hypothetical protein